MSALSAFSQDSLRAVTVRQAALRKIGRAGSMWLFTLQRACDSLGGSLSLKRSRP
jgi:hypothetical protein